MLTEAELGAITRRSCGGRRAGPCTEAGRAFVFFFFVLASLSWVQSMRWLTPVVTGFMVFLINTVIVIGDQMMRPFDLQWAGLPLQKFCVAIEHKIMNVSRRHANINTLLLAA